MKPIHRLIVPASLALAIGTGVVGCNSGTTTSEKPIETSSAVDRQETVWTPVDDVVLASAHPPGFSEQTLELVDVKGQYTDNRTAGPFQGPNWTGRFQLRLVDPVGKMISQLDLSPRKYTLFTKKFQFSFADYNGDGFPDFALGQYRSSNGYRYEIFTVEPAGIKQLPVSSGDGEIITADQEYSPLFPKVDPNAFQVALYDNSRAKWFKVTYTWHNGAFVKDGGTAANNP